jgi:ubiquinone/menaquinone biosynthesis C-methylase UbiE
LEKAVNEHKEARALSNPAEVYEQFFVPALFQQWGSVVANAAEIGPGQSVLDVACGTGVLACAAAERVGLSGAVVGLDPDEQMLAVARSKDDTIEWLVGRAEAIPFPDESFDAVVSQFGFMFFEDKTASLCEMMRVLRSGGHLAIAVCDRLEHSPGYSAFSGLLRRLFGNQVADAFGAPFVLGDSQQLLSLCADAGIFNAKVTQCEGMVRFESVQSLVSTERACVWTLGGLLDDAQFGQLLRESEQALRPFVGADGSLAFAMPSLILTAAKALVELPES